MDVKDSQNIHAFYNEFFQKQTLSQLISNIKKNINFHSIYKHEKIHN
jgi:hypothetical protein